MAESREKDREKPIRWVGRSREDLRRFPDEAKRDIGFALAFAQRGEKHPSAKPLKGFGGAGVLEISSRTIAVTHTALCTRSVLASSSTCSMRS